MTEVCSELQIGEEEIAGVFAAINKSGNGQISFPEFIQAALSSNIIVKEDNLRKVFNELAYNTRSITVENLKNKFG